MEATFGGKSSDASLAAAKSNKKVAAAAATFPPQPTPLPPHLNSITTTSSPSTLVGRLVVEWRT